MYASSAYLDHVQKKAGYVNVSSQHKDSLFNAASSQKHNLAKPSGKVEKGIKIKVGGPQIKPQDP
jgi:hypothetical protein